MTHVLRSSRSQSTQTTGLLFIHSQYFTPSLIILASPSPAVACIYLLVCSLCVRMAIGMNDCSYREVLLRGILNLSLLSMRMLSNTGLRRCVSSARIVPSLFVTNRWWVVSVLSCLLPTTPPSILIVVVESVFDLSGCIPTTASHAESYNTTNSSCVKYP